MAKWDWEKAQAQQAALAEVTTFYVDVEDEDLGTHTTILVTVQVSYTLAKMEQH